MQNEINQPVPRRGSIHNNFTFNFEMDSLLLS